MNDKPKLVIVGSPELEFLLANQDDLGVPRLYKPVHKGIDYLYVACPDEMRAWRALRSQSTSGAE